VAAKNRSGRQFLLFLGDIAIVLTTFYLALWIRTRLTPVMFTEFHELGLVVAVVLSYAVSLYIFEFYDIRRNFRGAGFLAAMGSALGLAFLLSILSSYIFQYQLGRAVLLISWVSTGLLIYAWRLLFGTLFRLQEPRRNVLIMGNGISTETIIPALRNDPEYRLSAIMDKRVIHEMLAKEARTDRKGSLEDFVEKNRINDIVLSFEGESSSEMERALVNCRMKGIGCHTFEAFYERLFEKLPVLMLNDRWFIMTDGFGTLGNRFYRIAKRIFDFAAAGAILIVTLPISLIAMVLVPLTSKGPAFFTQDRLGAHRVPFRIIKFRTMVHDAEPNGPQWAQEGDLRVTKLGAVLRRARIDEIPQLINVLRGEMSLIGPRPEREHFVSQLTEMIPFYSLRFFVKPGLTGWAQVKFRYGASQEDALEKLRYELYYIKNQSLLLDARILMKTVRTVLTSQGT
jgi:exopolysaccharide biosynthesis polyprenyl glycosylphosphotransferase